MIFRAGALVLALSAPGVALAQAPGGVFKLDTVLVVSFDYADETLEPEARRVHSLVANRLDAQFITKSMAQVPRFDEDYTAETYMAACPAGEHMGCAFVVGQRAGVDWVVTGIVHDDIEGTALTTSFIDVSQSEVLLSFGVTLTGDNDDLYAAGVADVMDKVIKGAAADVDVRGARNDDEAQAQMRRAQAAMVAASLSELEESLGEVERLESRTLGPPRLTREELDAMEQREDGAPWQDLHMSRSEYKRFRASGMPLDRWRVKARGRTGELLARISFLGGGGPYGQYYDGRYVLSDTDLSVIEVSQFQEISSTTSYGGELEVGFGVMRFLEVSGVFGLRSTGFQYLIQQSVQNDDNVIEREPQGTRVSNLHLGGRATFVPMPSYVVRPTATAGVAFWRGNPLLTVIRPPDALLVDADCNRVDTAPVGVPALLLAQVAPGAEVTAGPNVTLFARALFDIPLGGPTNSVAHCGAAALEDRPEPLKEFGVGISGQAGILVRFGLVKQRNTGSGRIDEIQFEDDDF